MARRWPQAALHRCMTTTIQRAATMRPPPDAATGDREDRCTAQLDDQLDPLFGPRGTSLTCG
jgi:hypothetical protein